MIFLHDSLKQFSCRAIEVLQVNLLFVKNFLIHVELFQTYRWVGSKKAERNFGKKYVTIIEVNRLFAGVRLFLIKLFFKQSSRVFSISKSPRKDLKVAVGTFLY